MREGRHLSQLRCVVGVLVAVATVSNTSHAALVTRADLSGDSEWRAVTNSEQFNVTNNGNKGSFADRGGLARSSDLAIGSFVGNSNLGYPIDFTALRIRSGQRSGEVGNIFSSNIITAVGTSSSGLLTFNYSNLSNDNRSGIVVTGSGEGSLQRAVVTTVPLPASAWLFLSALIGLAVVVRHNRKRSVDNSKPGVQASVAT